MHSDALTFINSSIIGSQAVGAAQFIGGRAVLAISATQFGTGVNVQAQVGNLWIPVCSSIVASQLYPFDASPGQYRLVSAGSSIGMMASLCRIGY